MDDRRHNRDDRDAGLVTLVDPAVRPSAGAIVQDEYDIDSPWHHHDMHQLQYAFEGAMEVEDAHGRHVLPRSLAGWIPAGVRHRNSIHRIRSVSILFARGSVPDAGTRVRIIRAPAVDARDDARGDAMAARPPARRRDPRRLFSRRWPGCAPNG